MFWSTLCYKMVSEHKVLDIGIELKKICYKIVSKLKLLSYKMVSELYKPGIGK